MSLCRIIVLLTALYSSVVAAIDHQFTTLTLADGLPSVHVNSVTQQRNGLIWIGTEKGAASYDGYRFEYYFYDPGSPNHISNNMVTGLAEGKDGSMWIATEDGVNRIDADGIITIFSNEYLATDKDSVNWAQTLFSDDQQRIWIGTAQGVVMFDCDQQRFVHFTEQSANPNEPLSVYNFAQAPNGDLYVGTVRGLFIAKPETQSLHPFSTGNKASDDVLSSEVAIIQAIRDGRLIVSIYGDVTYWLDPKSWTLTPLSPSDDPRIENKYFSSILETNNGEIWLGDFTSGITIIDQEGNVLHQVRSTKLDSTALPSDAIYSVYQDQAGLVWIGNAEGLSRYDFHSRATVNHRLTINDNSIKDEDITSVAFHPDGSTWVATDAGLAKLDKQGVENIAVYYKERPVGIWQILFDSNGLLWYGSSEGIGSYDPSSGTHQHYSNEEGNPHGLPVTDIYTILPDNNGGVWFTGYYGTGINYFNPEYGVTKQLLDENSRYQKGSNFSFQTLVGRDGHLWLATTDGVHRVDPETGKARYIDLFSERANIRATGIDQHPDGSIWLSTQATGLIRIETTWTDNDFTLKVDPISERLNDHINSYSAIAVDQLDNDLVWLLSSESLYQYRISTETFTSFPSLFTSTNLSFTESALAIQDSTLLVGSSKGAFIIDTAKIRSNRHQPQVRITKVWSGEHELNINANNPTIDYESNNLTFHFSSFDFRAPNRNQYRYKLVGSRDTWVNADNQTSVNYSNLPAGNYEFIVEGTNSDGYWSPHHGSWKFVIGRPWWAWVMLAMALLIIIGIGAFLYHRARRIKQLSEIAYKDPLTGLANRRQFNQWLNAHSDSAPDPFQVLFIDLDNFKHINDSFGHDIGDQYIQQVAEKLQLTMRPTDKLSRLGGDEFAILVPTNLTKSQTGAMLDRLVLALTSEHTLSHQQIKGSASIGVARYPHDGVTAAELLKNADTAMYAAKRSGKNTYCFYEDANSQQLHEEFNIGSMLFNAIEQAQIEVYYQAKVCCITGEVNGMEALARWYHPKRGFVSPATFIPVAEANGSIIQMGKFILITACKQAYQWHQQGLLKGPVSVNVSSRELHDDSFHQTIVSALIESNLEPHQLELELTESVLVENISLAKERLSALQAIGVKVSLDDFGTGFSSLSYLCELPLDTLKIDKSFIAKIDSSSMHVEVLATIFDMAERLHLTVVAEGVETVEQLQFLQNQTCHLAQGFLFSRPESQQKFKQWLQDYRPTPQQSDPNSDISSTLKQLASTVN